MYQCALGKVAVGHLNVEGVNLVKGLDDTIDRREAFLCGGNYTSRRNHSLAEFASGINDLSRRFTNIWVSYTALRECIVLLSEIMSAAPPPLAQSTMKIVCKYAETEGYLRESAPESSVFYNVVLLGLREEMNKIARKETSNNNDTPMGE